MSSGQPIESETTDPKRSLRIPRVRSRLWCRWSAEGQRSLTNREFENIVALSKIFQFAFMVRYTIRGKQGVNKMDCLRHK